MKNKKFIILLILTIILTNSIFAYASPYTLQGIDKPKIIINVEDLDTSGDLIYRGVDIALFGAKLGTSEYRLVDDKAQRILTNKTNLELDLSEVDLKYDYSYKIAYRTLYSVAGVQADKTFVAGESKGNEGWVLVKSDNGEDLIFKADVEKPSFSSIAATSSNTGSFYENDNVFWIKEGNELTITIKGSDKPSGIEQFYLKMGRNESLFDWENSRMRVINKDNNIDISSATGKELVKPYRETSWRVEGNNKFLEDIYVKLNDYSQNTSGYINTGYKLGVDNKAYKPDIKAEEVTKTRRKVIINAYDNNESGVRSIQYKIGNGTWQTVTSDNYEFEIDDQDYHKSNQLDNGYLHIHAKAIDNVGNVSEEERLSLLINSPPKITINSPEDQYEFKVKEKPIFNVMFEDEDGDLMDITFECNGKVIDTLKGVRSGENKQLTILDKDWINLRYYKEHIFKIIATDGKTTTEEEYVLMKINTPSEINVLKPANGQYLYQGYIKFEWDIFEPDNQGYGNAYLKVYTDTPNTFNNGQIFEGYVNHGTSIQEVFYYLPKGTHRIYFEITDGKSESVIEDITVKIDDMVDFNIDGNKTFYIASFDEEKSDIYYKDMYSRLTDNIYMMNILGKNGTLNEEYVKNVLGIIDVTGKDSYLNKGDIIYSKDKIDSSKISDWILEKLENEIDGKYLVAKEDWLNLNIMFEDEEGDYTSLDPNRGKNRRFKIFHIPTYYDNPDIEIIDNGIEINDKYFYSFDGKEENLIKEKNEIDGEIKDYVSLKIDKAGKYILNVVEEDEIKNIYGKDFSKTSPNIDYVFYAHRRPVAIIRYEENGDGTVKLISDDSYDPDFMYRKKNKGIKSVKWEYRELTYTNDIVTDWTEVPDINKFSVDISYRTYLKLTVTDCGALEDVDNIFTLEGTETIVFDKTGQPPKANFDINVKVDENLSIDSQGYVYKGANGYENVVLVNKTSWNDFFAEGGTRIEDYTKNKDVLNQEISKGVKKLATTLKVNNKFNLTDSITKGAIVKNITLNTPDIKTTNYGDYPSLPRGLKNKLIAGSQSEIKVTLGADEKVSWPDLKVTIQSTDLGINKEKEIPHEATNVFLLKHKLTNKENINYTIRVYSRRTDTKLIEKNFTVKAFSYISIDGNIAPSKNLFPGDKIKLYNIMTKASLNVPNVKIELHNSNGLVRNIGKINNFKNKTKDLKEWNDYNYKLPSDIKKGDYFIKLIAIDEVGNKAEKNLYFNVVNVELKNFRITRVYDIRWKEKNIYPIYQSSMPVIMHNGDKIKVGYRVDFAIDTYGLNGKNDDLYIDVSFENESGKTIYPKYKTNNKTITISNNNRYSSIGKKDSNQKVTRTIKSGNNATWTFSYFIPATTNSNINNNVKDLYVQFKIVGKKEGLAPILYNDSNNFDGYTFVYNLKNSALTDYYIRGRN